MSTNNESVSQIKEENNLRISSKRKPKFPFDRPFNSKNKSHFASIPSKFEIFLLPESKEKQKLKGFTYHTERDNPSLNSNNTPSVGEYNLNVSQNYPGAEFNQMGYLSGFISRKNRFKGHGSYLNIEVTPSGADYDSGKNTIENNCKNSLKCKSMYRYNKTDNSSHSINIPGPGYYTPNNYYNWKLENKLFKYNFDSTTKRPPFVKDNGIPGPGDYFKEIPKKEKKIIPKYESLTDRKLNFEKRLKNFSLKTEQSKDDIPFHLRNIGNSSEDISKNVIITNEDGIDFLHECPKHSKEFLNKKKYEEIVSKFENKEGNIPVSKFKEMEEEELKYIKQVLGNDDGRLDLFYLAAPRWKENKYKLKVPGPCYYMPKMKNQSYSYNRSKREFICPKGPEFI